MIACFDSGNSRIKWGLHDGWQWLARGAVAHAEVGQLARLAADWPMPDRVVLANVAGVAAAQRIRAALPAWSPLFEEIQATAQAGGVINHYRFPEKLGVDRWCALIGARGLVASAAVVVMAGTATTIDTLDAAGNFLGGLILPGNELMRRSLASDTAGLPFAEGRHADYPRCTDDAIVTGAIEAQVGAIERAWRRLRDPAAICLLSGGNGPLLRPFLEIPCREVPNLPLEGLLRIAGPT